MLLSLLLSAALAATPTADELLTWMDREMQFDTRTATTRMVVADGRTTRTYEMRTFGRGLDEAAVEYLAPDREKGTRMLKKGDQLWLYMPRAERTQKISGHMMRQGMMGSDISYEDMMASADFREQYAAVVEGEDTVDGRKCWKLVADAKDASVTYPRRIIWVDQESHLPLRQELYALSGMLLKTWTMSGLQKVDGRWIASHMVIADQLRQGSRTELTTSDVHFGVALEDEVFSLRWLERK